MRAATDPGTVPAAERGRAKQVENMSEPLKCEDFAPHVGEIFRLKLESGDTVDVELTEAEVNKALETRGGRAPFALVFRGASDLMLPQRLYELQHQKMGDLTLFLVPIGPDDKGMQFEAVFN